MKEHLQHERCPDCGLKIRCGDIEAHSKGPHHKKRVETLKAIAKAKAEAEAKKGT